MRFLGIGETNDLAAMYAGLSARGHEVRVFVESEAHRDIHEGLLHITDDWVAELPWLREAGEDGVVLFESAEKGPMQDELRKLGVQVVGGSALGDRLEADRGFGQEVLRGIGLKVAPVHRFDSFEPGRAFVRANPGRWVLKFNGAAVERSRNYVGQLDDGSDVLALMDVYEERARRHTPELAQGLMHPPAQDFVLMRHLQGVEVGVGAYFNGRAFLQPACIDFEHKHFFAGEMGELTGEMGTIVSYRHSRKLFEHVLAPLAPQLAEGGYVGYINVNLVVNDEGAWPLEFTSRFGYPGFAICEALHDEPWEAIFRRMLRRDGLRLNTRDGFACGVVLTVPPFPYREGYAALSKGLPIAFRPGIGARERERLFLAEVARRDGRLVTAGTCGYLGVATGTGPTVAQAADEATALASQVVVPNLRFRRDIGERVTRSDWATLERLGWV